MIIENALIFIIVFYPSLIILMLIYKKLILMAGFFATVSISSFFTIRFFNTSDLWDVLPRTWENAAIAGFALGGTLFLTVLTIIIIYKIMMTDNRKPPSHRTSTN